MAAYSDDDILAEIRRVADSVDAEGAPSLRAFREHGTISSTAVCRRFGSWNAAVTQAGFEPHTETDKIPRADLIAELRRLRNELGEVPTADQMDEHGAYAYITYYERFGSWGNALTEVFGDVPDREWEHVSDAELRAELHRLAEATGGERPTTTAVREHGAHAVTTYRDRFGSWRAALEAAGFEPPPPQGVSTAELLAEVRRLHDELETKPTTTVVREHGAYSLQTYYDRFESWRDVLEAAFETVPDDETADTESDTNDETATQTYTDAELLEEIRRVAAVADSDGAPSVAEFTEYSDIADTTIHRRFGSWNAGVTQAGFEPRSNPTAISDAELAAELRRLREVVGQPPTKSDMDTHGAYASATYKNHFGSWTNALTETFADVTASSLSTLRKQRSETATNGSESGSTQPHVSDETLRADLQTLADDLGHTPTSTDMNEHGSHSATTYTRRFGSWDDALNAADLDSPDRTQISDAELIADLQRLRDELGERPTSTDVAREGEYGLATYQRRFGSWGEAAAAAFDDTDA